MAAKRYRGTAARQPALAEASGADESAGGGFIATPEDWLVRSRVVGDTIRGRGDFSAILKFNASDAQQAHGPSNSDKPLSPVGRAAYLQLKRTVSGQMGAQSVETGASTYPCIVRSVVEGDCALEMVVSKINELIYRPESPQRRFFRRPA